MPRAKWWPSISFSSAMDLIDLTTDTEFDHSTWIGTGKEFSSSLPQVVYDKKREILKVNASEEHSISMKESSCIILVLSHCVI